MIENLRCCIGTSPLFFKLSTFSWYLQDSELFLCICLCWNESLFSCRQIFDLIKSQYIVLMMSTIIMSISILHKISEIITVRMAM